MLPGCVVAHISLEVEFRMALRQRQLKEHECQNGLFGTGIVIAICQNTSYERLLRIDKALLVERVLQYSNASAWHAPALA